MTKPKGESALSPSINRLIVMFQAKIGCGHALEDQRTEERDEGKLASAECHFRGARNSLRMRGRGGVLGEEVGHLDAVLSN